MRMKRKTFWRTLWLLALAFVLGFEFIAIFNEETDDTISENVWALIEATGWLGWMVIAAFLVWLTVHFLLPRVRQSLKRTRTWWQKR